MTVPMASAPPPFPSGRIWVEPADGGAVLHLRGEIDTATVADFERKDLGREDEAEPQVDGLIVAIDASGVSFLNSVGVRFLLRQVLPTRAAGRRPVLRNPSRAVEHVLGLTGVATIFDRR